MAAVLAVTMLSTAASPAPARADGLGDLVGGVTGVLDPLLDPLLGAVGDVLRPITGLLSDLTGLPIDTAVDDLVNDTVDGLLGSVDRLLIPDDGNPLAPPAFEDLLGIIPLEPADTLIEDVVYPGVIEPSGPIVGPVQGIGGVVTQPLGLDDLLDTTVGAIRDTALEPLGLDPAAYVIRATTAEGEVTRDALIDVPLPIDVTGDGAHDVLVELRILTARPSLRVTRLPGAPASLPLAIEAILAPGGYAAPERLAFGYDTLDGEAPGLFRATVADLGTESGELAVELHSVSPGPSVTLTAALYDQGPSATRIDPTDVRIGFTPVPTDATITAAGLTGGGTSGRVRIEVSEPSRVDAAVRTQAANGDQTEIGAIIDQVPGIVDLAVSQVGSQGVALDYTASGPVEDIGLRLAQTEDGVTRSATVGFEGVDATSASFTVSADDISYTASAPIEALTLELIDPRGIIDRATVLRARLVGLPESLGVTLVEGGAIGLDAGGGELGLLELQLASDPSIDIALPSDTDGILFRDLPDLYAAFLRLTALRSVSVTPAPELAATIRTAGGRPFVASIAQQGADGVDEIDARLSTLPDEVTVALTEGGDGPSLSYDASSVVDLLEVDVRQGGGLAATLRVEQLPTSVDVALGSAGLSWSASSAVPLVTAEIRGPVAVFGRATEVRVRLTDVPPAFAVALADGAVDLDAPGGIGLVEVLATDGVTELAVPDGVDGLVLEDTPDAFAAALRLTGLEGLSFGTDPLALALDTLGDRVFEVDVTQRAADGSGADVRATIDRLPSSVSLSIADLAGQPTLAYTASASVDSLIASIATLRPGGGATTIGLNVAGLPEQLTISLGAESITYSASEVVPSLTVEVTDPDGLLGRANRLLVALTDLPTDFTVGISGESIAFDAGSGTLGSLEALLTNGPELALPEGVDGLLLIDDPTDFVVAARIVGLHAISFGLDGAASFSLRTTGGRLFQVDVRQEGADGSSTDLLATLDSLPTEVSLTLGGAIAGGASGLDLQYTASSVMDELRAELTSVTPGEDPTTANVRILGLPTALTLGVGEDGAVTYTASDRVPELALDITDPGGIFGSATTLRLRALDLPTGITASVDPAGGLSAQTSGGSLGLLEALFTSGEDIGLATALDGIAFRDTADLFAAFVRITGLTGIEFAPADGGAHLALGTDGGRVFVVDALTEDLDEGTSSAIQATLDQLPSSVTLDLTDDPLSGMSLDYTASAPMGRLHGLVALTDADGPTTFELEVLGLPTAVTFALDSVTGAVHYTGSDRAAQLSVLAEDPNGIFQTATTLQALLVDLPPELEIVLGGATGAAVSLDAKGDQLGLLEVLATSGPNLAPAPGVDGVVLRDTADDFVLGLRVHELRQITVQPDPVAFTIGTAGGRVFVIDGLLDGGQVVDLGDDAIELQASFEVLPSLVTLGFGLAGGQQALQIESSATIADVGFSLVQTPAGGSPLSAAITIEDVPSALSLAIDVTGAVSYLASAPVPSLQVDAHDPAGLFDRADKLALSLIDLPTGLEVALSDTGSVSIVASGGRLGQLEALAYLNTPTALAADTDGVILEDLTSDYRVFARFTNIDLADVAQVPLPKVKLVGQGGRPLSIALRESAPGKPSPIPNVAFTTASLLNGPPTVELALLPGDPGTINVAYSASQTASSLNFQTNSGDRWITTATISNPVPLTFVACQTSNAACVGNALGQSTANVGSFAFNANQHTTLNVLDCARPLNASCTAANGTEFTNVNNLRVKDFQFGAHINQGTVQSDGRIYANTVPPGQAFNQANAQLLSGQIVNRDGGTRMNFTFGPSFEAWDRYRRFDRFPGILFFPTRFFDTRGGIVCGSGTNLSVTVTILFEFTFNANPLLGC